MRGIVILSFIVFGKPQIKFRVLDLLLVMKMHRDAGHDAEEGQHCKGGEWKRCNDDEYTNPREQKLHPVFKLRSVLEHCVCNHLGKLSQKVKKK